MLLQALSDCYGSRKEKARAVVIKQSECCANLLTLQWRGYVNIWREKNLYLFLIYEWENDQRLYFYINQKTQSNFHDYLNYALSSVPGKARGYNQATVQKPEVTSFSDHLYSVFQLQRQKICIEKLQSGGKDDKICHDSTFKRKWENTLQISGRR